MAIIIRNVPLDFDYPIGQLWKGYDPLHSKDHIPAWKNYEGNDICKACMENHNICSEKKTYCYSHPKNRKIWHYDPPDGDGYQVWGTVGGGSPLSPVFGSRSELEEWCRVEGGKYDIVT